MSEHICPHCGRPVYDDEALLCLYCGKSLKRPVGILGRFKYSRAAVLMAGFILLLVAAFILLIVR